MKKRLFGDCRKVMRELIRDGVKIQTCTTSPPYWGLRDYGALGQLGLEPLHDCLGWATGDPCGECHVCHMVEVFRLVRELLADDGTLWLNYGDCYASSGGAGWQGKHGARADRTHTQRNLKKLSAINGLKPKDLVLMPARIALALQADGWYVRSDIIWNKPNPMPESCKDRPTKSHEYLFLFSKQERYYYDADAIKEPALYGDHPRNGNPDYSGIRAPGQREDSGIAQVRRNGNKQRRPGGWDIGEGAHGSFHRDGRAQKIEYMEIISDKRNKRSVWTVPTQPYSGAHFATFPPKLIEPCILAGSRLGDVVLDPFFGSGTTGEVAERLGRQWIGIELNQEYEALQKERTQQQGLSL